MKKPTLTLLALLALTLTGCEKLTQGYQEDRIADWMYTVEYSGHRYVVLCRNSSTTGMVHDPDCPCREKGGENENIK